MTHKERHCPPTRFDIEPYGTICKVNGEDGVEYYVQVSNDEHMNWLILNKLLINALEHMYTNEEFIEELLELYSNKNRSLINLVRIIEPYI